MDEDDDSRKFRARLEGLTIMYAYKERGVDWR
jgi:hypothetical protein